MSEVTGTAFNLTHPSPLPAGEGSRLGPQTLKDWILPPSSATLAASTSSGDATRVSSSGLPYGTGASKLSKALSATSAAMSVAMLHRGVSSSTITIRWS
jgi:hypothetical protein